MDLPFGNGQGLQQQIASNGEVALGVGRGNATLVPPEKMDFVPLDFSQLCLLDDCGKELARNAASGESDGIGRRNGPLPSALCPALTLDPSPIRWERGVRWERVAFERGQPLARCGFG